MPGEAERENMAHELPERQQREISGASGGHEERRELDGAEREAELSETGEGAVADDRAGKTVAERLRAVTAGLLEKAGDWENAFAEWLKVSGLMQQENAALNERVMNLSRQLRHLYGT